MSFEFAMLREEHLKSPIFKKIFFPFVVSDRLMVSGAQKINRWLKDTNCVESNILEMDHSRTYVSCPVFLSNEYEDFKDLVIGCKFEPINIPGRNIKKGEIWYPSERISKFEQDELNELIKKSKVLKGITYPTYKYDNEHSCWKIIDNKYYYSPDRKKVYLVLKVDAYDGKVDINGKTYKEGKKVVHEVVRQNFYIDIGGSSKKSYITDGNKLYNYMGILENGYVVGVPFGVKYKSWTEYEEGDMYVDEFLWSGVVPSDGAYFPPFITGGTDYSVGYKKIPITKKKEIPDKGFCDFFNGPYFEHLVNLQEKMYELDDKWLLSEQKKNEGDTRKPISKETERASEKWNRLLGEYKSVKAIYDKAIKEAEGNPEQIKKIDSDLGQKVQALGKRINIANQALGWGEH